MFGKITHMLLVCINSKYGEIFKKIYIIYKYIVFSRKTSSRKLLFMLKFFTNSFQKAVFLRNISRKS